MFMRSYEVSLSFQVDTDKFSIEQAREIVAKEATEMVHEFNNNKARGINISRI